MGDEKPWWRTWTGQPPWRERQSEQILLRIPWGLWLVGFAVTVLIAGGLAYAFGAAGVAPGVVVAALWGRLGHRMRHSEAPPL